MTKYSIVLVISLIVTSPTDAAIITWGEAQDTTSNAANDVVDGGAVVLALNGQSQSNFSSRRPGPVTLDGVTFESPDFNHFLGRLATDTPNAMSLPAGRTTGDADYDVFLNNVAFVNTGNAVNTAVTGLSGTDTDAIYPIRGLTDNTDYLIQLWYTDERAGNNQRIAIFGDNQTPQNNVNVPATGVNGFGSFVVGTFTADASTQDLRIAISGAPRAHLTGLLVRVVAVPEPSSFSFIAAGAIVVASRRRRKIS